MSTPLQDRAQRALGGLISLLKEVVVEDGSFSLLISAAPDFVKAEERRSAFAFGLALRAIAKIPQAEGWALQLVEHIRQTMSAQGTWKYSVPYPDDLESTSICLHALQEFDARFMTGDRFAEYVKTLLRSEVSPTGPYATWITAASSKNAWQDVDPVANANIAALLSSQDRALAGLDEYLLKVLKDRSIISPYYSTRVAFLSALALADRETFAWFIRAEAQILFAAAKNPLDRALLAIALVNSHADSSVLQTTLESCLADVEANVCDQAYAVCLDRTKGGSPSYAGAPALTLALCAGAIFALAEAIHVGEQMKPDERMLSLKESVKRLAFARFAGTDVALRERAEEVIEGVLRADKLGEKTMFPYFVAVSLDRAHELDDAFFLKACLAHTLGWVAYTLYDNILDEESLPQDLSVANVCLRELTLLFAGLVEPEVAARALDRVDAANAWEMANCRLKLVDGRFVYPEALPDFGSGEKVTDRSWGIVLAARAVFLALGYQPEGEEILAFEEFVRHFLMAKQLTDDAKEWERDLQHGQLTMANRDVLARLKGKGLDVSRAEWMSELQSEMQKLYWHESLERLCSKIFSHVEMAGEVCEGLPEISRPFWRSIVSRFGRSARLSLEERERAMAFLKSMNV